MNETTNNLSIIFGWAGFAVFVIWILNMYFPELSMTPTEIAIKNNGKIVSTKEEVFIHRDWNYEPVKYYKHSVAIHENGKESRSSYNKKEISEWEFNKFMEENYETKN